MSIDCLIEIVRNAVTTIDQFKEIFKKLIEEIENHGSFTDETNEADIFEKIQELNEAALGDFIEGMEYERSFWKDTPYKPKWKPFMPDKRSAIKRCRRFCRDKFHKKLQKSSFAMSIPKNRKKRYNIDEIAYCMTPQPMQYAF